MSPSAATDSPTPDGTLDIVDPDYKPPEGTVILPSSDGGFVQVREVVKTVEFRGEEVELRRLTPEEKARRRTIRTIVLIVFGLATLTLVAYVLMMLG